MNKSDVISALKEAGYKPTVSVPDGIIDYQLSSDPANYNRVIIWEADLENLTPEQLREMMAKRL